MGGPPGPPGGGVPGADEAFSALQQMTPRSQNPTAAMKHVEEGLDVIHKIVMAVLPQISQINPKVSKDLHAIGQRVLAAKSDLRRAQPLQPPPDLMLGMGGGAAPGASSMGAPNIPGGLAGAGASPV